MTSKASVAAPTYTKVEEVVTALDALIQLIKFNSSTQVIDNVKSCIARFEELEQTYLLVEPLRGVKSAFEQRFPDASDEEKTFFDELISKCDPAPLAPAALNSENEADTVESIFPDELVHSRAFEFTSENETQMMASFLVFLASIWTQFVDISKHKYFAIVQSSGWGKTRLMDLYCKTYERVLIYACFRTTDSPASGYPLGVKAAKAAFEAIHETFVLGSRLDACKNLLRAVVMLACQDTEKKFQRGMIETQKYDDLWATALTRSREPGFIQKYQHWLTTAPKFASMIKISDSNQAADNFKVFLVFDEASFLLRDEFKNVMVTPAEWESTHTSAAFPVTAFRLLRRALWNLKDDFRSLGVVAVFIDTHSSISNFAPTASKEPSARAGKAALLSLPVYWQINSEPTMFTHLHPFLFGRPMIGGYYNAVIGTEQDIHAGSEAVTRRKESSVIRLCQIKMAKPEIISDDWVAAITCCLLDLEIRAGSALPEKLIQSYMATCLDVSENRERITTHYPCEPVLARGALNNLLALSDRALNDTLKHFQQLQRNADLGTRGETVAELICLLMLDQCESFDAKFPLTTFLQRLLGWTEEFTAFQVSKAFKLAKKSPVPTLNLCQFQFCQRYPTPADLKKCYILGKGMMMVVNAAAIDMVIPLKLSEDRYSAIVIQVKNWQDSIGESGAKSFLDAIGWSRVFMSITNKAFCQFRASKVPDSAAISAGPSALPEPSGSSNAAKKPKTTAVSKSSKSAVDEFVAAPPKRGSLKRPAGEAPVEPAVEIAPEVKELHALFKGVPYCKLLFLMRDTGENELFVEKNEMETVLCGVLRGMPRKLKIRDTFDSMVANFHTRQFTPTDERNVNYDFRKRNVDMMFADPEIL